MGIEDPVAGMQSGAVPPVRPVGAQPEPSLGEGHPRVEGADFARILDELLASAGQLSAKAAEAPSADPKEFRQAVEQAKQSLDSAMSLGEELLEAYRRARIEEGRGQP